ncbi:MAG: hypothetical protein IRY99_17590, partial [Isosphaeraceae bacterium]|nr:hypothetical protein [Isosphaeraceae bacterium]
PPPAYNDKPLVARIDALGRELDRLKEQVAAIPPSPALADVQDLKNHIADIERKLADRVNVRAEQKDIETHVEELDEKVEGLRTQVAQLRDRIGTTRRTANRPASEALNLSSGPLARGIELFQDRKYSEARDIFQQLQQSHPDDARVWYYSALARGFATNDWTGETQRLAERGVERERAGTPDSAAIDKALAGLTKATGKEWLDYFRRQARK